MDTRSSKIFPCLAYVYIALPILIFFIGWCNPVVASLGSIIILISFYFTCKNAPGMWIPTSKKQWFLLVSLVVIALIWVCWSGVGALVYQNEDHNCRNPVFELLVEHQWPVFAEYRKGFFSTVKYPIILSYYIAFWLPSALIGKMFHNTQLGYYAQILWASFGIFLLFYYILASLKRKNYVPILVFLIFSGLDIVGATLLKETHLYALDSHLEWWLKGYNYESFTTQLFWVFNQAIPAWLVTMMVLREKNNKSILFIYSCLLLHATLPSIGLFPIVTYLMLKNGQEPSKYLLSFNSFKAAVKSAFTFQNTIGMMLVTIVSFFYLSGNISGGHIKIMDNVWFEFLFFMIVYFPLEVGIYLVLIWKYNRKNPLLYIITACLIFIPSIQIGYTKDFAMRASIPSLVLLYYFVVKTLDDGEIKKNKIVYTLLILTLFLGANSPLHEFSRTVINTRKGITKIQSNLSVPNFFAYSRNNPFLKYFGKQNQGRKY